MKISAETNVADILSSHEKRIRHLELVLQSALLLSALRNAVASGHDLVEKIKSFSE